MRYLLIIFSFCFGIVSIPSIKYEGTQSNPNPNNIVILNIEDVDKYYVSQDYIKIGEGQLNWDFGFKKPIDYQKCLKLMTKKAQDVGGEGIIVTKKTTDANDCYEIEADIIVFTGYTDKKNKCIENSKYTFAVLPISNDKYGIANIIKTDFEKECYISINNQDILNKLDDNSIGLDYLDELNELKILKLGGILKVDFIFWGYASANKESHSNNSNTIIMPKEYGGDFTNQISSMVADARDAQARASYNAKTLAYVTLFSTNINTGENILLYENKRFTKN